MDRNEAIKVIKNNWPESRHQLKEALQTLIPELQESEDERVRKSIIDLVEKQMPKSENKKWMIAWLEKQSTPQVRKGNEWVNIIDDACEHRYAEEYAHITEQKTTDNLEPKFKVGDWIVQEGVGTYKVVEVEVYKWYEVIGIDGNQYSIYFLQENDCHLWTIQDAKDGDVLCTKNKCCPFIYDKGRYNNGLPDEMTPYGNAMFDDSDRVHPTIAGHALYARSLTGKLL